MCALQDHHCRMPHNLIQFTRHPLGGPMRGKVGTAALNALSEWTQTDGRSYRVKTDADEMLVAELTFADADLDASLQLALACQAFGVMATPLD